MFYLQLCNLAVLGLEKLSEEPAVYKELKKQLFRSEDGRYMTSLIWKHADKPLDSNKNENIAQLKSSLRPLEKDNELKNSYDDIIQEQLAESIIKKVATETNFLDLNFTYHRSQLFFKSSESMKVTIFFYTLQRLQEKTNQMLHWDTTMRLVFHSKNNFWDYCRETN